MKRSVDSALARIVDFIDYSFESHSLAEEVRILRSQQPGCWLSYFNLSSYQLPTMPYSDK